MLWLSSFFFSLSCRGGSTWPQLSTHCLLALFLHLLSALSPRNFERCTGCSKAQTQDQGEKKQWVRGHFSLCMLKGEKYIPSININHRGISILISAGEKPWGKRKMGSSGPKRKKWTHKKQKGKWWFYQVLNMILSGVKHGTNRFLRTTNVYGIVLYSWFLFLLYFCGFAGVSSWSYVCWDDHRESAEKRCGIIAPPVRALRRRELL